MTKRVRTSVQDSLASHCIDERTRQITAPATGTAFDARSYVAQRVWSNVGWLVRWHFVEESDDEAIK